MDNIEQDSGRLMKLASLMTRSRMGIMPAMRRALGRVSRRLEMTNVSTATRPRSRSLLSLHPPSQPLLNFNWAALGGDRQTFRRCLTILQKYVEKIPTICHSAVFTMVTLYIRPGPPSCSGLGTHGVRRGRHLIHKQMKWFYFVGNTWFGSILVSILWNLHRKNKTRPYGLEAAINRHDVCKFTWKFWHFDINGQWAGRPGKVQ